MRSAAIAKDLRVNDQISAREVRVIRDGTQLGVMSRSEALRAAEDAGLDLVEVAPQASPPVCRILDYGKFKYEQAKRERESRKGSKQSALREVRMRVKIDDHDIDFKSRTARKLLAEGDKVKVSVLFRAREITHPEVGRDLLDRFYQRIEDAAVIERPPQMEGRMLSMVVMPGKPKSGGPRTEARSDTAPDAPPSTDAPPANDAGRAAADDAAAKDTAPSDATASDAAAEPAAGGA